MSRRFPRRAFAASLAAAAAFAGQTVLAQPPPAAAPAAPVPPPLAADNGPRLTIEAHAGGIYRVGAVDATSIARGGGLLGGNVLYGPVKWLALGIGYDHAFLGGEHTAAGVGQFVDTTRYMNQLWALGRFYPWQNEDAALFVQLGLGPVWEGLNQAAETATTQSGTGQVRLVGSTCSGSSSAGLGLRGGLGVEYGLSSSLIFTGEVGFDHYRLSSDPLGDCTAGSGASTFLMSRLGFAFASGRPKAAPPPEPGAALPLDRDGDGVPDATDACPDVKGVPSADPRRNGCPLDKDADGILDAVDACPDVPGIADADPKKNGCPLPSDRDKDGIADALDACPDLAGVADADPAKNGCPPDKDGDGIFDKDDACPELKGVANADPKLNGCPPDSDGDGIRDDKDACPQEKGLPNEDPARNGCPIVQFTEKEIVISQQVQFENDKSVIRPESNGLLDAIAEVIKAHPEVQKLEVQGHTDNVGQKQHNKVLSQSRADSVKRALVKRGVVEKRLDSKGYGADVPIGDNTTDPGRAKNRRVQFTILKMTKPGDAPPADAKPIAAPKPKAAAPAGKPKAAAPADKPKAAAPADKPKAAAPAKKP